MNCFNSDTYLKEAIDSVFGQIYQNWEIIFWDNASTDNSAKIAKSYGSKLRYCKSDKTYPLGHARNLAIEQAKGDLIAFLDCDDIWLPQKLEKQVAIFATDPKIGLVFPNVTYFNKKGELYNAYNKKKPPQGYVFNELLKGNFLCLSSVIIRKEALSGLKEWFDNRFSFVEDWDLFLRIAYNWKLAYVDDVLVRYRIHKGSVTYQIGLFAPEEEKQLIEKFLSLYPDFGNKYREEVSAMETKIGYGKFCLLWQEKGASRKKARQEFKQFLKTDKKFIVPYLFSYFFPFSFFITFLRLMGKKIYSP